MQSIQNQYSFLHLCFNYKEHWYGSTNFTVKPFVDDVAVPGAVQQRAAGHRQPPILSHPRAGGRGRSPGEGGHNPPLSSHYSTGRNQTRSRRGHMAVSSIVLPTVSIKVCDKYVCFYMVIISRGSKFSVIVNGSYINLTLINKCDVKSIFFNKTSCQLQTFVSSKINSEHIIWQYDS